MGVESKFYILPDTSSYRPDATKVSELIKNLRRDGFVCDPKSPSFARSTHQNGLRNQPEDFEGFYWRVGREKQAGSLEALKKYLSNQEASDALIVWPNSSLQESGLKYPLSVQPESDQVYYDTEIHLAADTVYHNSEIIDPFSDIRCACGTTISEFAALAGDLFYDSRLPNNCPACQKPINYATLPFTLRDAWTGAESKAVGGTTYRFAIVVDCGKCWPDDVSAVVVPELLTIVERTLQVKARVVRDFY